MGCFLLESINIPDKVLNIGDYAFKGRRRLTSIVIPESVIWIGDEAFEGCDNLTIH